ncbi:MAG: alkaline phosphatase family protein [Candidatus Aminicenantes bacterium]|nr:alkaline phosphatase family protein [Candidatus Aminicenantes bacterium]
MKRIFKTPSVNDRRTFLFLTAFFLLAAAPLHAYIGPGAGFAFLSSFMVLFVTFFLAVFSFLAWPFRFLWKIIRGQKAYKKSLVNRIVIVGFDGMEPTLVEKYMARGKLPNFSRLKEDGAYSRLGTTIPAISPVAWSSFMTGCHPAKHNIFDFLSRNPTTYLPDLSSARIGNPKRFLTLGKYRIPLSKPVIKGLRKSIPFWKILGDQGIFSTILRIPITFPPEKFKGHCISGMCTPDLKGSQGTFSFYTTDIAKLEKHEGGVIFPVKRNGDTIETYISGPVNTLLKEEKELRLPLTITIHPDKEEAAVNLDGQNISLKPGVFSDWIRISFKAGLGMKIRAICRLYISRIAPEFEMYLTPLNIDPEKPALPISHPFIYSVYIGKLIGSYTTLGEADDTWALNEGILSEDAFIKLAYDNHRESEDMLFNALDKTKKGVVASWFQTTDSLQHMFFRYLDKDHPALTCGQTEKSAKVLEDLYVNMDELLGRIRKKIDKKSLLIIMSDHGFKNFCRGVNINSWLYKNGYLALKDGKTESGEWFNGVDWSRTRAYGLGLGGIYLNVKGREALGIVKPGEELAALKKELSEKLTGLRDDKTGAVAINRMYDKDEIPSGPYKGNCPDFIVGYNVGYRVSWDSVTGIVNDILFEDNTKAWSGDHCIDPALVPGVIFSSLPLNTDTPHITDIAPTVLDLFGIDIPGQMDGKPFIEKSILQKTGSSRDTKKTQKKRE